QPKDEQVKEKGFGKHRGGKLGRHGGMRGMRGFRGLHGIELTETQKEQLKQIHEANKPSEADMAELKGILEARKAGTELTADQKSRIQSFRENRRAKMEQVHQQVLAILTPEQKAQLETQKAERKQRMEQRREMWQKRKAEKEAAKPQDN
ncbi:MAG TPA: Spy/CpxP family protein refolding chaperone, partial [Pyrinomonadaceae bacterium]|nr:Spy/CpxP family protein refolding chaperone [Pyrinomonadaceae bacterium]